MDIEKIKNQKSIKELLDFGIINIDKPSGPTSFSVSEFVCKQLGLKKTSHFGTLDPKVTGVLPVALGRACKLTGYFLGEDKEYIGVMRMHSDISMKEIQEIINKEFIGRIKQTPPVRSRVKREERERKIYEFELLEQEGKDILFKVSCEGGTYIRKLIDDLGIIIKTGAHMLELRRIRAGIFEETSKDYPSVNLYDFEKAVAEYKRGNEVLLREIIIPGEILSKILETIQVKDSEIEKLLTGKPIKIEDVLEAGDFQENKIVVAFSGDKFIGIYKLVKDDVLFAKPEWVKQESI